MGRIGRGIIRVVRRSPNLFAFAFGLFLVVGVPCWCDSFFRAFLEAEVDASNGITVSPIFRPMIGLFDPLVRSGFAVVVMFGVIGIGVVILFLSLARLFSRWQLPPSD